LAIHSAQVAQFVSNLGEYHSDINRFKLALRDFLVQLKEYSDDNGDIFLEKEAEQQMKLRAEREQAMKIPGMLKPSQLEDRDEDI
jgi:exportin-1